MVATFDAAAGSYSGRWFDEGFRRPDKDGDAELRAERLWDRPRAESIRERCLGHPGEVTEESRPATQLSPLLYDLTTLQREANSRFGFSAKNTLAIAQALYERHKALTYPRTDSRYLPEDYLGTVRGTLESLGGGDTAGSSGPYGALAARILTSGWVHPNKRIFNNAKVSDHFAIIPTGQVPRNLTDAEQKLYDMVTRRFLAVFFPAAEFLETTRITRVAGEPFRSVGKVLVQPGWLEVYGREAQTGNEAANLVAVTQGEVVQTADIEVKASQTRPPARYTEATLLSAMEGAGKLVDDEELREAMSERGLGTPATRASIIEGLLAEDYLQRAGRELVPTAKAFSLVQLLDGLGVNELTRPELTGEWEAQLKRMERGQLDRDQFMGEIRRLTEKIVAKAKQYDKDTIPGDFGVLSTPCPKCGAEVHERYREFRCKACDFAVRKVLSGRMFEPSEVETLIRDRQVGPLQGFRSQKGFPFAAVIRLSDENEARFDFGNEPREGEGEGAAPDFTGKESLGRCPKCGANVYENGMNFVCEKAVGPDRACDFKTGAVILQQPVDATQVRKLLAEGRTDLLKEFVSKRNGRKFEAFLTLKDGKVGFDFPPRERKAGRGAKSATPAPKVDLTGLEAIGTCPRCGGRVLEGPEAYLCERTQADERPCPFKIGRKILEQPVDREQAVRLLETGRSDLLEKFISKSGKPFAARLLLGTKGRTKGKVEFEFPED